MQKRKITRAELEQKIREKEQLLESDLDELGGEARQYIRRVVWLAAPLAILTLATVAVTAWTIAARRARREAARASARKTLAAGALVGAGMLVGRIGAPHNYHYEYEKAQEP